MTSATLPDPRSRIPDFPRAPQARGLRLGLCCQFLDAPIRFRTATHKYVSTLAPAARRAYLSDVVAANAITLTFAVERCAELGIGAFRINSQIAPLATHPASGYVLEELEGGDAIARAFRAAGSLARARDVRLSFHPDQFVVLNSQRPDVVESSIGELEHQARMAELVGADTICLHGGSSAGGRADALDRLARAVDRLGDRARSRLALENDDRVWAPADLLPFCERMGLPSIYDVHHHRCLPDDTSVEEATERAVATWDALPGGAREPWLHLSSPRAGWGNGDARPHADFIDPDDVPSAWVALAAERSLTVDIEAKAKERAVLALTAALAPSVRRALPGAA